MHFLSELPGFGNSTLLHYFDVLWIITSHGSLCSWTTAQKHSERMWKLSFERESHVSTSNKRSNFSGRRTWSFVCMPYRSDHKRFFQSHNLSECPQPFIKTTLTGTSTQELSIQPQTLVISCPWQLFYNICWVLILPLKTSFCFQCWYTHSFQSLQPQGTKGRRFCHPCYNVAFPFSNKNCDSLENLSLFSWFFFSVFLDWQSRWCLAHFFLYFQFLNWCRIFA